MPESPFTIHDENPNEITGGGGCLCDPTRVTSCTGPYVVVPGNEMDDPRSPHVVIGASCVRRLASTLDRHEAGTEASARQHERPAVVEAPSRRKPAKSVPEV